MRKIKLFLYDHAPDHIHDRTAGYENTVPFSKAGIDRWCQLVDPKDAELFYCGQYSDKNNWKLNPNRFEHFAGNESRHVFDLEGDHSQHFFLDWMRPCIITAMNAEPNHRNWNTFVRPGCSNLLMHIVKNPPEYAPPKEIGFFFMGQPDPHGLRKRVAEAFFRAGVPGEFIFTKKWNAVSPLDDADVLRYMEGMNRWSFQLCPAGTGQMTMRFFEACAYGRVPVVIADNLLFMDNSINFVPRWHTGATVDVIARWFQRIHEALVNKQQFLTSRGFSNASYVFFKTKIERYFHDPTAWLITRLNKTGLLEPW